MGYCTDPQEFRGNTAPCRKCYGCIKWRQYQWRYRLTQENSYSTRTWFCSWTFRFTQTEKDCTAIWQKYTKRLRQQLKTTHPSGQVPIVRYFTVMEKGSQNSRLHLHSLMFCSAPIPRRVIEGSWNHGFSKAKIADSQHIEYVSKYVTKESMRTLASQRLGLLNIGKLVHPNWYLTLYQKRKPLKDKPSNYNNSHKKENE